MGATYGGVPRRGAGWRRVAAAIALACAAVGCGGGEAELTGPPTGGGVGAAAPLEVDPDELLEFSAQGGTILFGGPFDLTLSNPGGAALPWTATTSAPWVQLSQAGGVLAPGANTTVAVSLEANGLAGLAPGVHETTIHFADPIGGGDTDRAVRLVWTPDGTPLLTLEPIQGFFASGTVGGPFAPASKAYVVRNLGTVSAPWDVTTDLAWLTVAEPSSGVLAPGADAVVVVAFDPLVADTLSAGLYSGSILFTNVATAQTLPLPFALSVAPLPGVLALGATGLGFGAEHGQGLPAAQSLSITNTGGQTIAFSAAPSAAWLTVTPASGTLAPSQTVQLAVALMPAALALDAGQHAAAIEVANTTNGAGSAVVAVDLALSAAPPGLAIAPAEGAVFSASGTGTLAPPYKQYTVTNTGGTALAWSAAADQPWISVSTAGGTLAPGAQATLAVSVLTSVASELPPGDADGTLEVLNLSNDAGSQTLPVSLATTAGSSLATNLNGLSYYSPELPFVDLFRTAHDWLPQEAAGWAWDTGASLATDADGWIASLAPGQAAGTLLARDLDGHYPGGLYTLLFDGKGTFTAQLDGAIVAVEPGRILVQVTPSNGGVHLKLTSTDPSDPVRNIRFVMPGHELTYEDEPWNLAFLDAIAPFAALRFMDWQRTNQTNQVHWTDRATLDTVTQATARGASVEVMVELCNATQKDAWFCLPHTATDDYVRQFATLVRDTLDPERKIYVELSNEVWNGIFPQSQWAAALGATLYPGVNAFQAQLRAYSKRAVEVFEIWREVFGAGQGRLVCTLAGQMNPWTGEVIMDWQEAHETADAYAIAPYFGGSLGDPGQQSATVAMTVEAILDACESALPGVFATIQTNAQNADARGLRLLAYEGGQHLVGHGGAENNEALTAKLIAANRHAKMRDVYLEYLDGWKENGGELFFHFNSVCTPSKWGSWGALEHLTGDKLASPKYGALATFVATVPAWW